MHDYFKPIFTKFTPSKPNTAEMPFSKPMLTNDYIICLECNNKYKVLSLNHLKYHGLTPATYKHKHGLPHDMLLSCEEFRETMGKNRSNHYKKLELFSEDDLTLTQYIKYLRLSKNISPVILANNLNISRSSYYNLEKGKRVIYEGELTILSNIFKVDLVEKEKSILQRYRQSLTALTANTCIGYQAGLLTTTEPTFAEKLIEDLFAYINKLQQQNECEVTGLIVGVVSTPFKSSTVGAEYKSKAQHLSKYIDGKIDYETINRWIEYLTQIVECTEIENDEREQPLKYFDVIKNDNITDGDKNE